MSQSLSNPLTLVTTYGTSSKLAFNVLILLVLSQILSNELVQKGPNMHISASCGQFQTTFTKLPQFDSSRHR